MVPPVHIIFSALCSFCDFALSRILALLVNCKKTIIKNRYIISVLNTKALILYHSFWSNVLFSVFRIMSHCLKFLLLVSIAVLHLQANSAKDYDLKLCVTPSQFQRILNKYCANLAHKRRIRREGET